MKNERKEKVKKIFFDWSVIATATLTVMYFCVWFLPDILDLFLKTNSEFLKEYDAKVYQNLLTGVFFLRTIQTYFTFTNKNNNKKLDIRKGPNAAAKKRIKREVEKDVQL